MNVIQGTKTVSGEAVTFNTPREANVESLRVHFSPQQEGDGNPSPSNVRNIVPYEGFNVYHSGKNLAHIVRFSPLSTLSPTTTQTAYSNKYGTTIDTLYPIYPDTKLTITQSQYDESVAKHHYINGYFTIDIDNLKFGKTYTISFKVTNITSNPLNVTLNDLRVASPYGNYGQPQKIENDRIVFLLNYRQNANVPNRQHIAIQICGMSFTMSEFMVTDENETDFTWEPYVGSTGKNILQLSKDTFIGNAVGNSRITVANNTVSWSGSPDSTMNGGFIVPCAPNTTYIYSCNYPDNTAGFILRVWESEEYSTVYSDYTLLVSQSHRGTGNTATFTTSESTNCLLVGFYIYSTAAKSGGTADCFQLIEPYTFPKPSKNLIDIFNNPVFNSSIYSINNDGSVTISGFDGRGWTNTQINGYPLSAGTYTFSWTGCPRLQFATSEDNYANVTINTQPFTFTLNEDGFIKWKHSGDSSDYPITVYDQIEAGETATEYEPYFDGFYGGYVDLVSGELVVEWVKIRAKYRNWSNYSEFKVFYCNIVPLSFNNNSIYISDKLVSFQGYNWKIAPDNSVISGGNNYRYIFIKHEGVSSNAEFKDWLEEVDPIIVAKLQTPIHYPLSTQQIIAYKNKNNFWSSGDSVDVEYEYINIFDALESRKNIMKNTPHINTTDGNMANFTTDMVAPLKECKVSFEPKQNLNGYSKPWAAGCGKNLFNLNVEESISTPNASAAETAREFTPNTYVVGISGQNYYRQNHSDYVKNIVISNSTVEFESGGATGYGIGFVFDNTILKPNETYTINATCTNGTCGISFYDSEGNYLGWVHQGIKNTATIPENTAITLVILYQTVTNSQISFSNIQLEKGSTATSYEPYENVCPIEGWNSVEVTKCGKSIYPFITNRMINSYYYNGNSGWANYYKIPDNLRQSKLVYSVDIDNRNGDNFARAKVWTRNLDDTAYVVLGASGTNIPAGEVGRSVYVVNLTLSSYVNSGYICFGLELPVGAIASNPMVEIASEATPYKPYSLSHNIWTEQWENGYFNTTTGGNINTNNQIRCKNSISVKPNTQYYVYCGKSFMWMMFFDDKKNVISDWDNPQGFNRSANVYSITNTTFTTPENCYYIKFYMIGSYGNTYDNDISINYPSTFTDYEPYSLKYNVEFPAVGKNIFDPNSTEWFQSTENPTRPYLKFTDDPNKTYIMSLVEKDSSIDLSGKYFGFSYVTTDINKGYRWIINNGTILPNSEKTNTVQYSANNQVPTGTRCQYLTYWPNTVETFQAILQKYDIQLEKGSTATTYKPYTNTVYGGYVDIVNGELIITHKKIKIKDLSWKYRSNGEAFFSSNFTPLDMYKSGNNIMSDSYATINGDNVERNWLNKQNYSIAKYHPSDNKCIVIKDTRYDNVADFVENMGEVVIVYDLDTPIVQPLSQQVIMAIRGTNNIWSDTNGTTTVKYWKHITGTEAYQHVPAETIISDDDYAIVTDDGFVIGDENDYIIY